MAKGPFWYLYVTMQQLSGMHILQSLEELVHNILLVYLFKNVGSDNCMKVCLHVVENKVYVPVIFGLQDRPEPATINRAFLARERPSKVPLSLRCRSHLDK